jgi:hypothetical protein
LITADDLVKLPYTQDLTQAGIAYAVRSFPYRRDQNGDTSYDRLRRIVAGVAVDLAFRRYLTSVGVAFDVWGAAPFSAPNRYDLALGGRRCDLQSFMCFNKSQIRQLRRNPAYLIEAPALVPADQLTDSHLGYEDLYIFAFVSALVARSGSDLSRAMDAGLPHHIVTLLPAGWSRPVQWSSLGPLALKCDTSQPLVLTFGGRTIWREFQTETMTLQPRRRTRAEGDYYSLVYLHAAGLPDGPVGVHSPRLAETYIVAPRQWGNIWVYGMEIIIAGYLTWGEFRRRARRVPPGAVVLGYTRTRIENMAVQLGDLRPIADLVARASRWADRPTPNSVV